MLVINKLRKIQDTKTFVEFDHRNYGSRVNSEFITQLAFFNVECNKKQKKINARNW